MTYQPIALKDVPAETEFLQDLACTRLKEAELSSKYGFVFETVVDDLSSAEVCVVSGDLGSYFLVVCRKELPEWTVTIRTARSVEAIETYAPRALAQFIAITNFELQDIEHLWPFTHTARADA